jgi:hypothetical protein
MVVGLRAREEKSRFRRDMVAVGGSWVCVSCELGVVGEEGWCR